MTNKEDSIKRQFPIVVLVLSGVIAVVLSSVMIWAVFFPVMTGINYNTTEAYTNINTTMQSINGTEENQTVASYYIPITGRPNRAASLTVYWRNSTNHTNGTINVQFNGHDILTLPAANTTGIGGQGNTTTLTNATYAWFTGTRFNITLFNGTTDSDGYSILNLTLAYSYNNFAVVPENQQGNLNTLYIVVGVMVILVILAVVMIIAKQVG